MADSSLDGCHCCEGLTEPAPVRNDPGLPALNYRVDTQPGFYARMLQSLPLARADTTAANSPRPLAGFLTRSSDDPSVALVDACACVADVLTFYQERIANEGFLRTATERRSILELARAIGYELKPGVAASTHLAFTVEDAPGAPGRLIMAAGSPVQSVPPQGKMPQVFETSDAIEARAEWNTLLPRQVRPADMAVLNVAQTSGTAKPTLVLLGATGSFPSLTQGLSLGLTSAALFRLDPGLAVDAKVDAIPVSTVYFTDAAPALAGGDLLLFTGKNATAVNALVLRVVAAVADAANKRVRVDLEPLPDPQQPTPPRVYKLTVPYALKPVLAYARPQIASLTFSSNQLVTTIANQAWRESDLQAMIGIQRWNGSNLVKAVAAPPAPTVLAPDAGAFAFGAKLGFFGNNAPKWGILPNGTAINRNPYPIGWDVGDPSAVVVDATPPKLAAPRTIWQDSQGNSNAPQSAFLERAVANVNRTSWVVFDAPDTAARAYSVIDARETSRADYGLSGRAMALSLADLNGQALPSAPTDNFHFRSTTAYVASRKLALADLPIDVPIQAGDVAIELDRMVLGLAIGQPIALAGERADAPGVAAAEIAMLAGIVHADGRTTLSVEHGLIYSYRRASLTISANVVHATHGESVTEILGNGDASQPNQRFSLKKPPTTFLSSPAAGGAESTLEVRVNGVRWDEVASLYRAAPDRTVYITRIDDDATMRLTFGDGVQGARLPTGTVNVAARYRSGIGPDGEVDVGSLTLLRAMPLGLRSVSNPVPGTGAEGPEQLVDARRNAPLTLLTFDRVVSLRDYEDYARAFAGIGKARGDVLWVDGATLVFLTVSGATGSAPGSDVLPNLAKSITAASDPSQRFRAHAYVPRYFSCAVSVAVDPRYVVADVLTAVSAALLQGYGFDARELGQSVTAAEVMTLIHTVAGVIAVDLRALLPYTGGPAAAATVSTAVPAFGARWDADQNLFVPAELLLINPAAIDVTELTP
jgi:predicted phage baseplate assembly protein